MINARKKKADEEFIPCSFTFHNFNVQVSDIAVHCRIIKMEDSLYLWIGNINNPNMENLSYALPSNFERQPIATKILGAVEDATSTNMAKRLSMKYGKPVYVSFNLTVNNFILPGIEKRIQEELKKHENLLKF